MNQLTAFLSTASRVFYTNPHHHRLFLQKIGHEGFIIEANVQKRLLQGTTISAITNHWFSVLRGKEVNANERYCALIVGAATPLYDDLLDESGLTHDEIISEIRADNEGLKYKIELFHHLMQEAFNHIALKDDYRKLLKFVFQSQQESKRQESAIPLQRDELMRLTAEKGGYATLLFRHLLENPIKTGEEQAIFALGNLLQYANDLFDLWFDWQKKRQTLITANPNLNEIRADFYQLLEKAISHSLAMDYPKKNISNFLKLISLVASRGMVCLDHYAALAQDDPVLCPEKYSRRQLVCDMEKPVNILANLRKSKTLYRSYIENS